MHGQHQSCIGCELKGSARPTTGDPDFLAQHRGGPQGWPRRALETTSSPAPSLGTALAPVATLPDATRTLCTGLH